jgi:PAS domain S-box-containing protein
MIVPLTSAGEGLLHLRHDVWVLGGGILAIVVLSGVALALQRQGREIERLSAVAEAAAARAAHLEAREGRLAEALQESENRFQFLTDGLKGYAFFVLDPAGNLLTWNEAAEKLFGHRREEISGKPVGCFYPAEDARAGKPAQDLKLAAAKGRVEDRSWRLRKGGEKIWCHVVITAIRNPERQLDSFLVMTRDLSEHKQTEEALHHSRIQYRNLTETARDLVLTLGPDGVITSLNPAFEKIAGWPRSDWLGEPFPALVHPEDVPRIRGLLDRILRRESVPILELRLQMMSRDFVTVEFTATPQELDGRVIGCLGIARDLSERKRSEEALRKTEEQLRQAQKMEAVGRLAGGIAHDFNNLLTVIIGFSDMLLSRFRQDGEVRDLVQEIKKAGQRAASLTRQLLAFSRKQMLQPQVIDLNSLVRDLDKMLRRLIGEDIDLATDLHAHPMPVKVDPGQMEQVLMNLAVNARDAMPRGGRLTLETARVLAPGTDGGPGAAPAALLCVTDTGCGLSEHVKAHLFEPFFTTKEQGKGTGLGLATVYGIIQQSGGQIEVASEPGRFTTFKISLPLVGELSGADPTCPAPGKPPRGAETILLAEDEGGVRELTRRVLEASGYTVLEASDGQEALARWEQHPEPIQLLLTDVVMPQLGGVALAKRLKARLPHLKVIYMSGYTDSALARHGMLDPNNPYLPKPFTSQDLTRMVREILDEAGAA